RYHAWSTARRDAVRQRPRAGPRPTQLRPARTVPAIRKSVREYGCIPSSKFLFFGHAPAAYRPLAQGKSMLDVIVLEDEPVLRLELGEFLEELGYAPLCLSTLEQFEQQFDASRHRLAIIDIGLPDGCGLELIKRLRASGERAGIIIYSAS